MQIVIAILFVIYSSLGAFFDPLFATVTILFASRLRMAGLTDERAVAVF